MVNVLFGILVVGITGYSPITLVPIIVSIAGAIANGFCYFAFYETHSPTATMIGAIMADLCWMVRCPKSPLFGNNIELTRLI